MNKFKVGDKVSKPKGYAFDSVVVAIFQNTKGETRIVAEMENNGMLHIFNENQLQLREQDEEYLKERIQKAAVYYMNFETTELSDNFKGIKKAFETGAKWAIENEKHFIKL